MNKIKKFLAWLFILGSMLVSMLPDSMPKPDYTNIGALDAFQIVLIGIMMIGVLVLSAITIFED